VIPTERGKSWYRSIPTSDRTGNSIVHVDAGRYDTTTRNANPASAGASRLPAVKAHDVSRVHILGRVNDFAGMLKLLRAATDGISAIDLRAFVSLLTAELRRQFRAVALVRFYELLDRHQPKVELVNDHVNRLRQWNLTTD
jgi:hypothetical protein